LVPKYSLAGHCRVVLGVGYRIGVEKMILTVILIVIWLCIGFKAGVDLCMSDGDDFRVEHIPFTVITAIAGLISWLITKAMLNSDVVLIKGKNKP
jgi:hypothetical protein